MSYKNNKTYGKRGSSNIVPTGSANLSTFNLSEGLSTTMKFDKLYPVYWEQMNPNDRFDVKIKSLGRLMPMVAPTMSNIKMKYFAFYVPNRLIWKNWTKFMGERIYEEDNNDYVIPQLKITNTNNLTGSIADYMGVPPKGNLTKEYSVSALPFRAYNKIWNEWFRSNELQSRRWEIVDDNGDYNMLDIDSATGVAGYELLTKGKPADYFTSCLPSPQQGEPVQIPLVGDAHVLNNGEVTIIRAEGENIAFSLPNGNDTPAHGHNQPWDPNAKETNLYADMSNVSGVNIEALRKASALQVLLEKDARAGELYTDLLNVHYGTRVPDFLTGRSQFLGSVTSYINIEPIAQTGGTTDITPQGNLAGVGVAQENDKLCECSSLEHGILMILACAEGEVSYQQGLPRKFSPLHRFDYMFPEFWNLGDQAVLNKEIFVTGDSAIDEGTFGYQERYRELREGISKISGLMRSSAPQSLDIWHLAQNFENTPTLSDQFIKCQTPIDRVMAVPTEDSIILNCYFDIKATRALPTTSNPSILAGRL